jgi:hypothetical protein
MWSSSCSDFARLEALTDSPFLVLSKTDHMRSFLAVSRALLDNAYFDVTGEPVIQIFR